MPITPNLGSILLGIRETLLPLTQPLAAAHLTVAPSRFRDYADIAGAALAVSERIFTVAADADPERRTSEERPVAAKTLTSR